jgi:hypothetical protein
MSQEDVLKILKELGGKATTAQIRERAKNKYPDRTLFLYITNRLKRLEHFDRIKKEGELWKINI